MIKISNNMPSIYDLDKLIQPFDFITDPADGIERVEIISIALESLAGNKDTTVGHPANETQSIFEVAQETLKTSDPLEDSFTLVRVILQFSFFPTQSKSSGEILLVNIALPNECIISNESARHLVNKYIERWELVKKTLIQSMLVPEIYLK